MSFIVSTKPESKSSRSFSLAGMGKKGKDIHSPLIALLPGAKIDGKKGKITINIGISNETVIFNVGGIKFETFRSTLNRQPHSLLANDDFLRKYFRENKGDYFFDRDPDIFKAVLNYLRTGELHMPPFICGPAAKTELEFWGVPDSIIEKCCYSHYNSYNSTLKALNQLERDRHGSFDYPDDSEDPGSLSKWGKFRKMATVILNHPEVSESAKVYGIVSLIVVIISIISFLAETHPNLRMTETKYDILHTFNNTTNSTEEHITERKVPVSHPVLHVIDLCCMVFFTVEYLLRLLLSRKRCQYACSIMGLIDLCALLPDYIEIILLSVKHNLAFNSIAKIITVLKITRILRIFRLVRHIPGLWILIYTLKASLRELLLMVAFLLVGMLIFSSLIFYADDQTVFTSIPHSFWWALITMTTVGYGDMYPVTEWGYVIGSLTAMCGLLMIGFSVPILVNNFMMYYQHVQFALQEEKITREQAEKERKKHVKCTNNNSYV